MITLEQAKRISALVAAIREADEALIDFTHWSPSLDGGKELEAKVSDALEALDMFLDEIIDYRTA
ncbi:MobD.4 hypothetical protein [Escherichia phage vB_EcoM_VR7]|uniref:Uncharacterized protein mobD.4 n=1 Tax=Escherichia phage vB_EcoM_VR7 TaxID=700939 RepID=E5FIV1_9CAUD|nr:MobD.4 hypothetical protein [Escherichia phage vB_EcoM_VR7]ADR32483.1 MobD.4 hypothetical protein [Escherichia phage vB_EcoM_VR7]